MRIFCDNLESKPDSERRLAFRAVLVGTKARLSGLPDLYPVNDLSVSGLSLAMADGLLAPEQELGLDLLIADKVYLAALPVKAVRCKDGECACSFGALNRQQELKLDKLILEMQKRYIARQKQQNREENPDAAPAQAQSDSGAGNLRIKLDDSPFN